MSQLCRGRERELSQKDKNREEDSAGRAYDARLIRRLVRYLHPYRLAVAGSIALLFVGAALELVGPWITMMVLDRAVPARDEQLLLTMTAVFAGTLAVSFVIQYVQSILTTWLAQRVMFDIRVELFSHLQ